MTNIQINSITYIRKNFSGFANGSGYGTGIIKSTAINNALNAARQASYNASLSYTSIGTSVITDLTEFKIGRHIVKNYTYPSYETGKTYNNEWYCNYNYNVRTSEAWLEQIHLTINISGLILNNIQSATLRINNNSNNSNETYYICAPKDSNSNIDNNYYDFNNEIFSTTRQSFSANSFPIDIDITNQLKQCISTNKNVLVITSSAITPSYSSFFDIDNLTISCEQNITACSAPTSISNNGTAYIIPGQSISLSWSGAIAGNNNPIAGYRIYWKSGANPYIGGAEGYYDYYGTETSISFNSATLGSFPQVRGNTYYFKICTRGSYAVNNAFLSPISETSVRIVCNQLPDAPSVSVDKSRIKSIGSTTINFTVTPGSDPDTSQTKTLYYATSSTGTKNMFTSPLSETLNAAATYYFWTYDGYEFSENYTEKNIRLNMPPTITSVTMSAVQTFTPTTEDGYVKNINGSAQITKDPDATLTYSWKLYFDSSESNEISSNELLTNIDVTQYGIIFGKTYKLQLIVTDDLGESAGPVRSNQTFGIPAAPTITFYNQHNNSDVSGTTAGHFDTDVRFKYSVNNTGIDIIELWNGDTKIKQLNKNNNEAFIDTTLDELTRGTSYNLKLKFICNNISTFSNINQVYRVADITPTNITITPSGGSSIKPYTQQNFNINFDGYVNDDVSGNLSDIYTIQISTMLMNCSYDLPNQNNINGSVILNDKTTTNWKTLLGLNNAPNAVYTLPLTIIATNLFGKTFTSNSINVSLNFIESLTDNGSTIISIKNTNDGFTNIPNSYTFSTRYPLFETQTIKLTISGIQCYADQSADIEFYENTIKLGTVKIANNDWTAQNNSHIYQLTNPVEFQYTIPKITSNSNNINYLVKVVLANNQSNSYNTGLNICKYCKFNESDINFSITNINYDENHDPNTAMIWSCDNFGADSNNISSKTCQLKWTSILTNDFNQYNNNFGSSFTINTTTGTISNTIQSMPDILYAGAQLIIRLNFINIGLDVPAGKSEYTINLTNLYTLYNQVPNLLYGKNFFLLNGTSIGSNSDGMLYLHTTGSRTKIYFGNSDQAEFEITQNGLIIDGGTWDT